MGGGGQAGKWQQFENSATAGHGMAGGGGGGGGGGSWRGGGAKWVAGLRQRAMVVSSKEEGRVPNRFSVCVSDRT